MEHWTLALAILGALTTAYFVLIYAILLLQIIIAVITDSDAMKPVEQFYEIFETIHFRRFLTW
jgi:hypothetical protein